MITVVVRGEEFLDKAMVREQIRIRSLAEPGTDASLSVSRESRLRLVFFTIG